MKPLNEIRLDVALAKADAIATKADANSPEYEAAREAHNRAFRVFDEVRKRYRAREVDDKVFLAAKKKYDEATKAFDVAYEKAQEEATRKGSDTRNAQAKELRDKRAGDRGKQGSLF